MTTSTVLQLSKSQSVDTHAVITEIPEPKTHKENKTLVKVQLCDSDGGELAFNVWEAQLKLIEGLSVNYVFYIFGAWLSREDRKAHLTANDTTIIVKASCKLPLAKTLSEVKIEAVERHSLSKTLGKRDFKQGPALSANASAVEFLTSFKKELPEELYEIPGVTLSLVASEPEDLVTKEKDRIWTRVNVTDFSGTVAAFLPQEPALVFSGYETKDEFVEGASSGCIAFSRGRIRARWASDKQGSHYLTIACAECELFAKPDVNNAPASDEGAPPVQLSWCTPSHGRISVQPTDAPQPVLASGVLAVVQGVREPETVPIAEGFAIQSHIKDICEGDGASLWKATASAPVAKLGKYNLPKREMALIQITQLDPQKHEMTIADMWRLPQGQDNKDWDEELKTAWAALKTPTPNLKRKVEELQNAWDVLMPPAKKRIHENFGSSSVQVAA